MNITSDSISTIAPDLVAALGELTDIKKGREAKVPTKAGSSYSYTYADLADTLQSVRPILTKHNLAILQSASGDGDVVRISTTILHTSGEWITTAPLSLPAGRSAQETGSAISYGRRYHLLATLGLAAEDDDGASAGGRGRSVGQARPPRPKSFTSAQPLPPSVARTASEALIRDRIAELGDASKAVKQAFVAEFGRLADLDPERHDEALTFVEAFIAQNGIA
jgi:hypothetical protein